MNNESKEVVMPVRRKPVQNVQAGIQQTGAARTKTDTHDAAQKERFASKISLLKNEVKKAIIGKDEVIERVLVGFLANGNILIEDFPGLAKTLLANTLARALGCDFKRVQFTPDLLPSDITGTKIFNEATGEFVFERGPLFTNILLTDEINRAPPKTQAALLEAMQERQVSISGVTYDLPRPFIVIATQNPIEYEGTYPLPEAQLDRFMMKMEIGYPTPVDEEEILKRRMERKKDEVDINGLFTPADILEMQMAVENVFVDPSLRRYIVDIVNETRKDPRIFVGSSPRGSLSLLKLARARALIEGRSYIIPDDIKSIVGSSLSHRIILKPEFLIKGVKGTDIIREILGKVPVPKVENYVD